MGATFGRRAAAKCAAEQRQQAAGPAPGWAAPSVEAAAKPCVPVNVWEFEYPWLEYRRSRVALVVTVLLLLSLGWAAHAHRVQLNSYWNQLLERWPQLHTVWMELVSIWAQCQAILAEARHLWP